MGAVGYLLGHTNPRNGYTGIVQVAAIAAVALLAGLWGDPAAASTGVVPDFSLESMLRLDAGENFLFTTFERRWKHFARGDPEKMEPPSHADALGLSAADAYKLVGSMDTADASKHVKTALQSPAVQCDGTGADCVALAKSWGATLIVDGAEHLVGAVHEMVRVWREQV
jgi:hypothetical protein